ncbi:MAG: hypothetical protein HWD61_01315 [Parachlamydiaceae bacterium]|nr:MAG: hypothetical protein HWD61_01315 [Parachlamydiaceae bacterium]
MSNRNIAVFKPLDEEPLAKDSSKFASQAKRCFLNVIRRIFNCFQTAIFCCSGNAHKAEAAAWLISKHLGLNNVPLTKLTTLESPLLKNMRTQTGSLQVFINKQDLVSAEKLLKIPYFWSSFPQLAQWHFNRESEVKRLEGLISQEEFEKMVIIDIVQGNLDRHQRNWLVAENKIYCIDNGYAMPNKHPQNRFTGKTNTFGPIFLMRIKHSVLDQKKLSKNTNFNSFSPSTITASQAY